MERLNISNAVTVVDNQNDTTHTADWAGLQATEANLSQFMRSLEFQRSEFTDERWKIFVETDPTLKEWRYFLMNDPYTRWGYVKPRGYPGDAVLMDFAYKHPSIGSHIKSSSSQGKSIYKYTSGAQQSLSAISRTKFISHIIEEKARSQKISVASIASGHGREIEYLSKNSLKNITSFLAVDSDRKSLEELQSSHSGIDITGLNKNIFKTRLANYGSHDVVYSLGLFDYLKNEAAKRVLDNMCCSIAGKGTVVVANLHHQAENLGYCEAIMDWWMIPRSEEDLKSIAENLQSVDTSWNIRIERLDCFCYLIIEAG